MVALGNILHVNLLVYAHWFMSFKISQMRDYYISIDQDRYATSIGTKYLDTAKFNKIEKIISPLCHLI